MIGDGREFKEGDYWYIVRPMALNNDSYIAAAKKEQFIYKELDMINEPGDIWFKIEDNPQDAFDELQRSLSGNNG